MLSNSIQYDNKFQSLHKWETEKHFKNKIYIILCVIICKIIIIKEKKENYGKINWKLSEYGEKAKAK